MAVMLRVHCLVSLVKPLLAVESCSLFEKALQHTVQ
jgi:hypothetical protein